MAEKKKDFNTNPFHIYALHWPLPHKAPVGEIFFPRVVKIESRM